MLVLEARDRVGGRTYTVRKDEAGWVDLGGAYIGRTQNHLLRLIKEFDLKMYPVNEKEKIVHYSYVYDRVFGFPPSKLILEVSIDFRMVSVVCLTLTACRSWTCSRGST